MNFRLGRKWMILQRKHNFQLSSSHSDASLILLQKRCTFPGCPAVFTSRSGFKRHILRHQGIYPYHCPYCDKGLSCTNDIKKHLKSVHTGQYGFHCVSCLQQLDSVHALKAHIETCKRYNENRDRTVNIVPKINDIWANILDVIKRRYEYVHWNCSSINMSDGHEYWRHGGSRVILGQSRWLLRACLNDRSTCFSFRLSGVMP